MYTCMYMYDIDFFNESTCFSDDVHVFSCILTLLMSVGDRAHCVPSIHFTSSGSSQTCELLHELQAMEDEFDELDRQINTLISENDCV